MLFSCMDTLQAPEGESQPSTYVDLFVSTEKVMVLNTDLQAGSYIAYMMYIIYCYKLPSCLTRSLALDTITASLADYCDSVKLPAPEAQSGMR